MIFQGRAVPAPVRQKSAFFRFRSGFALLQRDEPWLNQARAAAQTN